MLKKRGREGAGGLPGGYDGHKSNIIVIRVYLVEGGRGGGGGLWEQEEEEEEGSVFVIKCFGSP